MSLDVAGPVMASYGQIDAAIAEFQAATHLHCPPGCGACCTSPNVETTPLELLPLVWELFNQGLAEHWLAQAAAANFAGPCVFYQPDPAIAGNGRCGVYPWRPSICRLFGFATVTDKAGAPQLAACWRHKELMPDVVAQAQTAIQVGTAIAPNFATATQAITNLDPTLGNQRLPINAALKVAIERVGLYLQMTHPPTDPEVA